MDVMREEAQRASEEYAAAVNAMRSIEAERQLSAKKQLSPIGSLRRVQLNN